MRRSMLASLALWGCSWLIDPDVASPPCESNDDCRAPLSACLSGTCRDTRAAGPCPQGHLPGLWKLTACGMCGYQQAQCLLDGDYGPLSECLGQGHCVPGDQEARPGTNGAYHLRSCTDTCQWSGWRCEPLCGPAGRRCGGDGCGGSCGECPAGRACTADGRCVAAVADRPGAVLPDPFGEPAVPAPRPEWTGELEVVALPAGAFLMGSAAGHGEADEHPQREIHLGAFSIDVAEVTVERFRACVLAGACSMTPESGVPGGQPCFAASGEADPRWPANCISWATAAAYCAAVGGRLPNEAEWERAARGGCERRGGPECTSGTDDPDWPWEQDAEPDCDHVRSMACDGVTSVDEGFEGRSAEGLRHMAGNVAEWVADCYAGDAYRATAVPVSMCTVGVLRGGSHLDPPLAARVSDRRPAFRSVQSAGVGFRCAYDLEP